MNLEEVKEHFKNAEKVKCLFYGKVSLLSDNRSDWECNRKWGVSNEAWAISNDVQLWHENKGFAEIISYKKDAQRIKEDCDLLDKFVLEGLVTLYRCIPSQVEYVFKHELIEQFKKDNGLIIEPEKPKYSESVQQAIDALTNEGYLITIEKKESCE